MVGVGCDANAGFVVNSFASLPLKFLKSQDIVTSIYDDIVYFQKVGSRGTPRRCCVQRVEKWMKVWRFRGILHRRH